MMGHVQWKDLILKLQACRPGGKFATCVMSIYSAWVIRVHNTEVGDESKGAISEEAC